jgi:hypothetical protein
LTADEQRTLYHTVKLYEKNDIVEVFRGTPKVINNAFVLAKDSGEPRLILDGRLANNFFESTKFSIPTMNSVLISPASYAVKFDLKSAFLHFEIAKELRSYLCFRQGNQVYTWKKLPFGTVMAPYICQKIMDPILMVLK